MVPQEIFNYFYNVLEAILSDSEYANIINLIEKEYNVTLIEKQYADNK